MSIQGTWPIEPTTFYIFTYYETNGIDEPPTHVSNQLATYNDAEQAAKEFIADRSNEGVCIIQPITCVVVYPFKPWEDF